MAKPSGIEEVINPGRDGGVVSKGQNESAMKVAVQNIVHEYKPKERCFRECALAVELRRLFARRQMRPYL